MTVPRPSGTMFSVPWTIGTGAERESMARLRDTFARQVWLRDLTGDVEPGTREIHQTFSLNVHEILSYLTGVPGMAVVFDSTGTAYSIRVVPSAGQHGQAADLPAASYLCEHLIDGLQAAYLDYLDICRGATWTAVGGREHIRGIKCSW